MRNKSPRDFWKYFSKRKNNNSNISVEQFYNYFKNIADCINCTANQNSDDFCARDMSHDKPRFSELDEPISLKEVHAAISCLKKRKAYSLDEMINHYFISTGDIIAGHLADIFNIVFDSWIFPSSWMEGIVIPLHTN